MDEKIDKLIGRQKQIETFDSIVAHEESALCVVYGRRRVGKTFLINSYFHDEFAFKCTGLSKKGKNEQLQNFTGALNRYASGKDTFLTPSSWYEAFESLRQLLISKQNSQTKQIVFIDELPWMDTPRSNLITALEHFWNDWACTQPNIVMIICGSATSWISKKILKNRQGLHNRTDYRIYVEPFTLAESKAYLESRGIVLEDRDIAECYMIMGGIPYYLKQMRKGQSLAQNIDEMFFMRNGRLEGEYQELYASLYENPEPYVKVVEALGTKNKGLTKEELIRTTKLTDNGHLKDVLDDLDRCNIIRRYQGYGKQVRMAVYQLIDPFTLFHLRFIRKAQLSDKNYWTFQLATPTHNTWCGLAFEQLCLLHHRQIEQGLGIHGIQTEVYAWTTPSEAEEKAQIDLIIQRADHLINVCEMKYYDSEYTLNKRDAENLRRRVRIFRESCSIKAAIHPVLITTFGLKNNEYASAFQNVIKLSDLFKP